MENRPTESDPFLFGIQVSVDYSSEEPLKYTIYNLQRYRTTTLNPMHKHTS